MLVIRRFDAVLEPKHDEVVAVKKKFEKDGVAVDIDPALCGIAGQAFVNKSDFTLRDLKSRTNQQQLRKDFIDYLDGFSKNVQEIINKFHFRDQIPRLSEQDRLGLLIEKLVDPSMDMCFDFRRMAMWKLTYPKGKICGIVDINFGKRDTFRTRGRSG